MTAGLKVGDVWVHFGRIKFRNKLWNWPWNWADYKPSTTQQGHCMLVNKFPTEFAVISIWSEWYSREMLQERELTQQSRTWFLTIQIPEKTLLMFWARPKLHFCSRKCDSDLDELLSKTWGLCSNVEITGCKVWRRNAPRVQKVKWQKGGNVEQEEREDEAELPAAQYICFWMKAGAAEREVRGERNERENERKDRIDASANVN